MQFQVNELYSNANGRVQFIELIGQADNQQALANFSLTVARSVVQVNIFLFSGGLPSAQTAGRTVLLATQDFANLGLVTPDFIIPNNFLFLDGATLTFPANGLSGPYDILSYSFLPTDGATSVDRSGATAISSPRNFAGVTGAITGNPIPGTAGADNLLGTAGADFIGGGTGNDTLNGGAGDDTLHGSTGTDTASYAGAAAVAVSLAVAGAQNTGGAGTDTLVLIENLTGGSSNDALTGDAAANVINGASGNDTMAGGAGSDIYIVNTAGDVVVEGAGAGTDTVRSPVSYALPANVEKLVLTGTGNVNATGNDKANTLTGNAGRNALNGGGGNDTLDGLGGNDTLNGGAGNDTMNGAAGNDIYVRNAAGDVVIEAAGQGNDLVQSSVTHVLEANVERLTLIGTGHVDGAGNTQNNVLTGNAGNNVLNGGNGADTLHGLGGDDTLVWSAVDLLLDGGAGVDALRLTGGNLNLTTVANTTILNVETVDLAGAGNNILTLNAQDVLDLSTTTDTLTVLGDAGDSINIVGAFTDLGVSGSFHRYDFGGATLLVDLDITSVA